MQVRRLVALPRSASWLLRVRRAAVSCGDAYGFAPGHGPDLLRAGIMAPEGHRRGQYYVAETLCARIYPLVLVLS